MGSNSKTVNVSSEDYLAGGGDMGARMREMDWAGTPLGPVPEWSQSLKTAVRIMLTSRQPMFVWWGKELINLYNDAYKSIVGGKHPQALGQPASVVWSEIWEQVGPRAESAMLENEGTYDEALLLIMERYGYQEETYYTFSYSPVPDDDGGTGGIICANTDDTERIVGERQLKLLRELATKTAAARTLEETCRLSAKSLETNPYDLPFAMLYLMSQEQQQIILAGTAGIKRDHPAVPDKTRFDSDSIWQFAEVLSTNQSVVVPDLGTYFSNLPTGIWQIPPDKAVLMPIPAPGQSGIAGILVVGLNPYRLFDDKYRRFLELISGQIAAGISNAQAYEEERKRAEALAEIDHAKTEFFSNVSHEFRTPLTLMLGNLEEVLAQDGKVPSAERELIETAHRNSLRLLKLVNNLLDFSRIEAGRAQAVFVPTNLSQFTADLASNFRSAIEKAGMKLLIDCPPLSEDIFVDREMWEKIVLNLLSNAFKFTFEGEIEVKLRENIETVELSIRDTGMGIPTDQLAEIFKRFHRVQNTQGRTYEGTGIGLSLVEELVKQHQGEISVTSQLGQGTTFTVKMPTGKNHLPVEQIGKENSLVSSAVRADVFLNEISADGFEADDLEIKDQQNKPGGQSAKILLADDNADMRQYVRRLLNQAGYQVAAVGDGQAALEVLQLGEDNLPDLILTDVMMPRLDGFTLLDKIRRTERIRKIPVILLSARAGEESQVEGLDAGADDYIQKPFSARELLARVNSTIELAKMRRQVESEREKSFTILESVTDAFYALDRNFCFAYVNRQAEAYYGIKREELLGRNAWELFPAAIGTIFQEQYEKALSANVPVEFEAISPFSSRWVEVHAYPSPDWLLVYLRDVTLRKESEAALRESEERFVKAFNASPLALTISSLETGKLIEVNETFVTITGYSRAEVIGRTTAELGLWKKTSDRDEELQRLRQTGQLRNAEYRFLTRHGQEIVGLLSAEQIEIGGESCALTVIQDITERKQAEGILERYRLLSEKARDIIWLLRSDGQIVEVNQAAVDTYGYSREELLTMNIRDLREKSTLDAFTEHLEKASRGNVQFETVHRRKNGTAFPVEVKASGADFGGEQMIMGIVRDITERKTAERSSLFLSAISEKLRLADNADNLLNTVCEMTAKHFNVSHCGFSRIDQAHDLCTNTHEYRAVDVASTLVTCRLSDFPNEQIERLNKGQAVIVEDAAIDPQTAATYDKVFEPFDCRAYIAQPILRNEVWGGTLFINDANLRHWTESEITLLATLAERTWLTMEKLRGEQALRFSEAQLQTLFDETPVGVYLVGADFHIRAVNPVALPVFGDIPDLIGRDFEEVMHILWEPEYAKEVVGIFRHTLTTGEPYFVPERIEERRDRDVTEYYEWHVNRLPLPEGGFGVVCYFRDISTEVLARQKIAESEEINRLMIKGAVEYAIFALDLDGRITTWNEGAKRILGWEEKEIIGQPGTVIFTPEDRAANRLKTELAIAVQQERVENERWHLRKDGTRVFASGLMMPLRDEKGNLRGFYNILRDQTERQAAEQEREQLLESERIARQQAEQANRLKDEFLATVSHELRTPLNAILGWAATANKNNLNTEVMSRALKIIERSARNQNQIISDILDVSRIITGKLHLNLQPLRVSQVIQAAIDTVRPSLDAKQIQLETDFDEEAGKIIVGDSDRLQQIFWNLLSNAVKFTSEGGKIEVARRYRNGFAEIIVIDNGCGIEPEFLPFVFDRFRQADGSKNRKYGGLGLGLAVVRHLTELHGGTVEVKSEGLNKGASFTVRLPIKLPADDPAVFNSLISQTENISEQSDERRQILKGINILVVDDQPDVLDLAAFILAGQGALVLTAESVDQALEMLDRETPDIIVSDIGMPEKDGFELIRAVNERTGQLNLVIPVIAQTAYAGEREKKQVLEAGFRTYLAKPLEPSELIETIALILNLPDSPDKN